MIPLSIDIVIDDPRYTPARANPGDAGADLKANLGWSSSVTLNPGEQRLIPTGVRIAIPHGWVGFVTPRSGLALKQRVRIGNAPGTIDAGYRNEVGVIIVNGGSEPLVINDGDRIAQLVILPCWLGDFEVVDTLPEAQRGQGGFGSSGV